MRVADAPHELAHDNAHVIPVVAQRGDRDVNDVQTIVEVFEESAGFHTLVEVAGAASDDVHIDEALAQRVAGLNLAVLEKPQESCLRARAHVVDVLKKQRPAVDHFQPATITKQVRLEDSFRHAGAVERSEGLAATRSPITNQPGDGFFPDATFAGDQNLGA